ncbi:hypothetical protein ACWDLG_24845 [Nonomuraea sp. NPDC003727]
MSSRQSRSLQRNLTVPAWRPCSATGRIAAGIEPVTGASVQLVTGAGNAPVTCAGVQLVTARASSPSPAWAGASEHVADAAEGEAVQPLDDETCPVDGAHGVAGGMAATGRA